MMRGAPLASPGTALGVKCRKGGGSRLVLAKTTPSGARTNGTGACPVRANASNRIGAAVVRPTIPGTGAPSGRPTQTPMVMRPSKPTAQASR